MASAGRDPDGKNYNGNERRKSDSYKVVLRIFALLCAHASRDY